MTLYARSLHPAARLTHVVADFGTFMWPQDQPVRYLCHARGFTSRCVLMSDPAEPVCAACARRLANRVVP